MSDPRTLADRLCERCCPAGLPHTGDDPYSDHGHTDCWLMRSAAVALRHHADLLDAIGDPDELRAMVRSLGLNSIEEDRTLTKRVADIADAVDGPT